LRIRVEVFSSPGCGKCGKAKEVLRQQVDDIGADRIDWREVNILDEMDYVVDIGVLSTPAIAINGELIFSGLPSVKKLRKTLDKYLCETSQENSG